MNINCPKCNSTYNLDKKELYKNGRKLKCFVCKTIWLQYPSGKAEKVKEIADFIDEIKLRQDSIKSSLEKSTSAGKPSGKLIKSSLNKKQEREFLEVLAIDEIQENKKPYKSIELQNSGAQEQPKNIGPIKKTSNHRVSLLRLNHTFFGFIFISIILLPILTLIIYRNLVPKLKPSYQEKILEFLGTSDVLIDQVQTYILILQDYIYTYF